MIDSSTLTEAASRAECLVEVLECGAKEHDEAGRRRAALLATSLLCDLYDQLAALIGSSSLRGDPEMP